MLMSDPMIVEVLDAVETAAINVWRSTNTSQHAEREVAWHSLKAVERVRSGFQSIADDGRLQEARRIVRLGSRDA